MGQTAVSASPRTVVGAPLFACYGSGLLCEPYLLLTATLAGVGGNPGNQASPVLTLPFPSCVTYASSSRSLCKNGVNPSATIFKEE